MPELHSLLAHYPILKSLAANFKPSELKAVAQTSKQNQAHVLESIQALKQFMHCEGHGLASDRINTRLRDPDAWILSHNTFASGKACIECGEYTCWMCHATAGDVDVRDAESTLYLQQAIFVCKRCDPGDVRFYCICNHNEHWNKPWLCLRCLEADKREVRWADAVRSSWDESLGYLEVDLPPNLTYIPLHRIFYSKPCKFCRAGFGTTVIETYCKFCEGIIFSPEIRSINRRLARGRHCLIRSAATSSFVNYPQAYVVDYAFYSG